jgi:hypothetical protein
MPIPRHSMALAHVQLAPVQALDGVTELRVHGVGGTPPAALLGDLSPEQVGGDAVAGFYRSADHRASEQDRAEGKDVDRHVEAYSWGGLTSRSKIRVLWLALLPFLLGNLAGWMCSAATRNSTWRFRVHRLASGLAALALTVNAVLVAAMISANVLAYQTVRGAHAVKQDAHATKQVQDELVAHQGWLAPLRWSFIAGHPGRQILIGVAAVELLVLILLALGIRSWRYESVRPPVHQAAHAPARKKSAAALANGLADEEFWDGGASVRLASWLHVAVATGFLALFLSVTVHALAGSGPAGGWWWTSLGLGGATIAVAVIYLLLDAFDTLPDMLRTVPVYVLLAAAGLALAAAGVFAWLQSAEPVPTSAPAQLPGLSSMLGWTALAIAASVALVLTSTVIGMVPRGRGTLAGGPWVTLMLAFGLLNLVLLGVGTWVAHVVGPVTTNGAIAVKTATTNHPKLYLPYLITEGVPLVALAGAAAVLMFGLIILARWRWPRPIPEAVQDEYRKDATRFVDRKPKALRIWYRSGVPPFVFVSDGGQRPKDRGWRKNAADGQFMGGLAHRASWLLWGIVVFQLAMAVCVWHFQPQAPAFLRNAGILLAGLTLPALAGWLWAGWNDPDRRRKICVLWDVGTFWPRSYHPLSPPCYAERAVPDLQRRLWWLHDNGGRVVLVAHSQGAVLATAALVQRGCRPKGDEPVLITFGNPVRKLYQWGFPAYLPEDMLESLDSGTADDIKEWKNIYYPTDPIGGPVGVATADEELCDPAECYYVYGQNPPSPTGHSGYWADLRVWELINRDAALLAAPLPVSNGSRHWPVLDVPQLVATIVTVRMLERYPPVLRRWLATATVRRRAANGHHVTTADTLRATTAGDLHPAQTGVPPISGGST